MEGSKVAYTFKTTRKHTIFWGKHVVVLVVVVVVGGGGGGGGGYDYGQCSTID